MKCRVLCSALFFCRFRQPLRKNIMCEILFLETVDSTNRVARELAEAGKPHGYSVLAESQQSGRGRLGRAWQSPAGKGIYSTIIVRPELSVAAYAQIPLTAGLAVSLVLEEMCALQVQLKWPNDLYIVGRKCGGILVESSPLQDRDEPHFALVGIGVNVNGERSALPLELQSTATSIFIESGRKFEILQIFTAIRARLLQLLSQLAREGFAEILGQWRQRDMLQGRWMQWLTPGGEIVCGESLGVEENGVLKVRDANGVSHIVLSGDVTLAVRSDDMAGSI